MQTEKNAHHKHMKKPKREPLNRKKKNYADRQNTEQQKAWLSKKGIKDNN